MKPADVKSIIYVKFSKENNYKDSKFKVADCVGISKYKKHFCKILRFKLVRRVFVIKKVTKHCVLGTLEDLNRKEFFGTFYEKEFQKINQKEFRTE